MKKLWISIKDVIMTYLVEYFALIVIVLLYAVIFKKDITTDKDILNKLVMISLALVTIPLTIYLVRKFKRKENKINILSLLLMIPLGIGISLFYNSLTIGYNETKEVAKISLPIIILFSGIIGPIFEEILFRYVCYNKAKKEYPERYAILIATTLFAILHTGIIAIIYAFLLGLVLIYVYRKYDNIMYPIIVHMSANIVSIFIKTENIYLLGIGTILLMFSLIIIKKAKH